MSILFRRAFASADPEAAARADRYAEEARRSRERAQLVHEAARAQLARNGFGADIARAMARRREEDR